MKDLLSIVVPIYNVSNYLDRCVNSIVSQDYDNVEIILVDDGSKDDSGNICDSWKKKDNRIIVVHKANGGLADARNAGIEIATGKYIAFVDGDDSVDRNMYTCMISEMEANNAAIACCGKKKIYDNGKIVETQCTKKQLLNTQNAIASLLIGSTIDESACDKVFRKELFDGICFPKGEINEDLPVMPLVFSRSNVIIHVGQSFYNYFQNSGSITRSGYSPKMHVYVEHLKSIEVLVKNHFPEIEDVLTALNARYCSAMLYRIYSEPNGKKIYKDDYEWFKKSFKKAYPRCLKHGCFALKTKLLFACQYMSIGPLVSFVNNVRKEIRKVVKS